MVRLFIIMFLSLVTLPGFGQTQDYITFQGKLINVTNHNPVPYASITISGTSIGTSSNQDGNFSLHIPVKNKRDSIRISILGFKSRIIPIENLKSERINITLEEKIYELDEVSIAAGNDQLQPKEIIKLVRKNEKNNLPDLPHTLSLFFRETYQLDNVYFKLIEAAAKASSVGYPSTQKQVHIDEIRMASGVDPKKPLNIDIDYNPFNEFQGIATGRIVNLKACKTCEYEIEKYFDLEDHLAVVLKSSAISPDSTKLRLFRYVIDLDDMAILEFDFESIMPAGEAFNKTFENGIHSSLTGLKRTIQYKKYNNKYYLSQYHQALRHYYSDIENDTNSYTSEHQFHVITNHIAIGDQISDRTKRINYNQSLSQHKQAFNPEFWKHFNLLEQTPLDKKIISDLEQNKTIEELFGGEIK